MSGSGTIGTAGAHAYAVRAQSIGGGGGNGGAGSTGLWSVATVGGKDSGGGKGGSVKVALTGAVNTTGDGGVGIFAQSVGGGGGSAGDVEKGFTDSWADLNIGSGVGIQSAAGSGGDGGDVTVTSGAITTKGALAHGVIAQSIGGSGGFAGISGSAASADVYNFAGSAGDGGNGGDVTVTTTEPITVSGISSHGIFAQSVGGSGSGDTAGDVTVAADASISALGQNGRGMLLQSDGAKGNGTIAVTVAAGATISTGTSGYETIGFMDGKQNTLDIAGKVIKPEGTSLSGYAVRAEGGQLAVTNGGTLQGSILLDNGYANELVNNGALGLGLVVNLGSKATLENGGVLSAATDGTIGSSTVTGGLTQTAQGTLQVDFDIAGSNDLVTIAGGAKPAFAGSVLPVAQGTPPTSGASGSFAILSAGDGLASDSLAVENTATVAYSLSQQATSGSGAEIVLGYAVDYTAWESPPAGTDPAAYDAVKPYHTDVGNYVNGLARLRQADMARGANRYAFIDGLIFSILRIGPVDDLLDAYDRLTPSGYLAAADATTHASLRFADQLNSCPQRDAAGSYSFGRNGSCLWMQTGGISRNVSETDAATGYDESVFSVSGGAQVEVADELFTGFALGYERFHIDADPGGSGDGNRYQAGLVIKREIGAATLAGSISGGIGNLDLARDAYVPGGLARVTASPDSDWIAVHARATYRAEMAGAGFAAPYFDIGATRVRQNGFSETGGGDYGLQVSDTAATFVSLNPGLEFGRGFDVRDVAGQFSARIGYLGLLGDDAFTATTRLVGQNGAGPGLTTSDNIDRQFADLGLALHAVVGARSTIEAEANALLGEHQQDFGGSLFLRITF